MFEIGDEVFVREMLFPPDYEEFERLISSKVYSTTQENVDNRQLGLKVGLKWKIIAKLYKLEAYVIAEAEGKKAIFHTVELLPYTSLPEHLRIDRSNENPLMIWLSGENIS